MRILLNGDIHASESELTHRLDYAVDRNVDHVVFLGDFGWKFHPDFLEIADSYADHFYVDFIDGNHEDFDKIESVPVSEDGYRYMSKNVRHIPRGTVITYGTTNILCLGGASSIDKRYRVEGETWWPQEDITDLDVSAALINAKDKTIHMMLTHEGPMLPGVSNKDDELLAQYGYIDEVKKSQANRDRIKYLIDELNPSLLFHGHHHTFWQGEYGNTAVTCLDREGSWLTRSTWEIDADF